MSGEVDRRRFLKYSGAASAVAGGVWVAPSVLGTSAAFAAGSCQHTGALLWTNVTGGTHEPNKGSSINFTVSVPGTGGGPTARVKVTVTAVGGPGTGTDGSNGGVNAGTPFNGYSSFYKLSMTDTKANVGYDVKFDFYAGTSGTTPIPVYNLAFKIIDIDRQQPTFFGSSGFNDRVWLTDGFTTTSKGSQISGLGSSATPWIGTSTGGVTGDTGTVAVKYAGPVNSTTMSYRSFEYFNVHQTIAITDLSWCY